MKTNRTMRSAAAGAIYCAAAIGFGEFLQGASLQVSDIQVWLGLPAGAGVNESVLVIDWRDGDAPWAWGYRWDSSLSHTGGDMLSALVLAEPRFSVSGIASGFTQNFAWDADQNGTPERFNAGYNSTTEEFWVYSVNNAQQSGNFIDGAAPTGAHVLPPNGNPYDGGSWVSSNTGILGRPLANGSWDGFSYSTFSMGAANEPVSAPALVPEPSGALLVCSGLLLIAVRRRR